MAILKRILKLTHQEAVIKVVNEDVSPASVIISLGKDLFRFDETMNGTVTGSPATSNTAGQSAPTLSSSTAFTTGGILQATTYYYVISALNSLGETLPSNELAVTFTTNTSSVTLTWTPVTGATSYRVYRGTAANSENLYITVKAPTIIPAAVTFTDTGVATNVPLSEVSFSLFANGCTIARNSETIMILHENDSNIFEMSRAKDASQQSSDINVTMGRGTVFIRVLKEQGYLQNFRPEQNGGL